ncbi:hypothetical protein [Halocatena halophila]|uniref:hypothetical protein n=1 Tax=Halocatena halophila TaxID=2814576 RepID=UPI002ED46A49
MSEIPELSMDQRLVLSEYFSAFCNTGEAFREPVRLALVLANEKPATIVDPPPDMCPWSPLSTPHCAVKLLDSLNLEYQKITDSPGWFVAKNSMWLEMLPSTKTVNDAYHRRLGTVMGYPHNAIEEFVDNGGNALAPRDYVDQGIFTASEIGYTAFVCYLPINTENSYQQVISLGKERYRLLQQLSNQWGIPNLGTLTDNIYRKYRAVFARELSSFGEPLPSRQTA